MQDLVTMTWLVSLFIGLAWFVVVWRSLAYLLKLAGEYAALVEQCGYLPPSPTPRGVRLLQRLSKILVFIQVGKVKVLGAENLDKVDGATVVTPNHPHWADTVVMPIVVNRKARYMAAQGVFQFGGGLGGLLVGPLGAFSADLTPGKGGPARNAAIKVLVNGELLVMFPEGWAYLDGTIGEFKKGAVRIVKEAATLLGQTSYLLPTFIRYGKYPGSWIRKLPPAWEYLLIFLLFPVYRRGCTVVIGEPIPSTDLPEDDWAATEYLRERVLALDPLLN